MTTATSTNPDTEQAKRDMKQGYENVRRGASDLASSAKEYANAELGGAVDKAQEEAKLRMGQLETQIRKNPTQAALIAAGVGFLVGLVVTR